VWSPRLRMKTLEWDSARFELRLIDQRILPGRVDFVTCRTMSDVAEAITNMTVRGAPAIGAAAAYGMALVLVNGKFADSLAAMAGLQTAAAVLKASRPTAVNLAWAVERMLAAVSGSEAGVRQLSEKLLYEANRIAEEDVATNLAISRHGSALIQDGDTLIHHCNTGSLATVDWGTALGCIRMAHEQGKHIHVLVDETRPRLQGSRLTAWELQQYGISYEIITDNAAGYFLRKGDVQRVFFGADRVTANGDVANKVGSYMLALAAHANHVPVYSVFPTTTVDLSLVHGDQIPIEDRDEDEVLNIQANGQPVAPPGARARNPAFDITPHHLLTGLVTEKGVLQPPYESALSKAISPTPFKEVT
jgi:methylthioribose-1-phosphate isomerase